MALDLPMVRNELISIVRDIYAILRKGDDAATQSYCICDEATDNYLILLVGWDVTGRVLAPCVHFRIYEGKVWVEAMNTDLDFIEPRITQLLQNDEIVLGFLHPEERPYSDYAVA
jgi:XisI protein